MAGRSIKLFQFNQEFCQTIGIELPQSNRNRYKRKAINLILIVCLVQYATATAGFLVYDAKSMGEYSVTFFAMICIIEALIDYLIIIWKLEDISKFIENCEKLIGKSE